MYSIESVRTVDISLAGLTLWYGNNETLTFIAIKIAFNPCRNRISPGGRMDTPTNMGFYWSGFTEKFQCEYFSLPSVLEEAG